MMRLLPSQSSSSETDESSIKDSPVNSDITGSPQFRTFMSPITSGIRSAEDNDSANLSNKIARLKEDEYAKVNRKSNRKSNRKLKSNV